MAVTEAVSRSLGEAVFPSDGAAPAPGGAAVSSSGGKSTALLLAMLLTLGSVGILGYTQWWVPREQAQQVAKVNYEHCLVDVKVYRGKHSYQDRLAQCTKFLGN